MRRLKDVATLVEDVLPEGTDPEYEFDYLDIGNVSPDGQITGTERLAFADAPSRARRRVRPGDTIISTVRTYLKAVALIGSAADDLVVSTGFAVLRPRPELMPRFLWRLLQSDEFVGTIVAHSEGVSYPAIAPSELMALPVWCPPSVDEQRELTDFIDAKIAKLDALVERKRSMIAALERRFDALAEDLIDPLNRSHERLRHVAGGVTVGVVVNPSGYVDPEGEVPFLRGVDVKRFKLDMINAQKISLASSELLVKSRLRSGDVVSVRVGEPGTSAIVTEDADGANCASLLITRSGPAIDSRYLCYVFNSAFGRGQFRALSNGAAQLQVNVSDAVNFLVPMPALDDQRAIAHRLDEEWELLGRIRATISRQVQLLVEQRDALVSATVTGQIDVRDRVA